MPFSRTPCADSPSGSRVRGPRAAAVARAPVARKKGSSLDVFMMSSRVGKRPGLDRSVRPLYLPRVPDDDLAASDGHRRGFSWCKL